MKQPCVIDALAFAVVGGSISSPRTRFASSVQASPSVAIVTRPPAAQSHIDEEWRARKRAWREKREKLAFRTNSRVHERWRAGRRSPPQQGYNTAVQTKIHHRVHHDRIKSGRGPWW